MILNTGQRTDIPAFYSKWFMNRIRAGFVMVRSPYNPQQVTKYLLNPTVVDVIGFCTKNPAPMLPYLEELKDFGQYWYVTITPYGKDIEPNVPDKTEVIESFKQLSTVVGAGRTGWRYDPIFLNERYTVEYHIEAFTKMAESLSGYTDVCVISFIDLFRKVVRNFPQARAVEERDRHIIGKTFSEIGRRHGIKIVACGEGRELEQYGVDCDGCMTGAMYEKGAGCDLIVPTKNKHRVECACYLGADIGAYDSCGHLCRYCYANTDKDAVKRNMVRHDPNSPFLIGGALLGDIVKIAEQKSWKNPELNLFR